MRKYSWEKDSGNRVLSIVEDDHDVFCEMWIEISDDLNAPFRLKGRLPNIDLGFVSLKKAQDMGIQIHVDFQAFS